ncbi:P2-like prophage tail protein X [Onishia taeanensis]|uniref:P2-like prophage tail protein X n=1 Tax=Onishia taeanensis TaxID=284577 RepID=A0A1G7VNR8_9GAMM|nr:tail protein X [Halomonas taeanensis]SDG61231.1 P2-like prophage tail protein X [Halomonas taeanensis]
MRTVYAHQYETLDALCYRVLGETAEITEQVLRLNPGLAELGPRLPQGTAVILPGAAPEAPRVDTIQLWT